MAFEVDSAYADFQEKPELLAHFMKTIQFSGHNIPSLSVLSHEIDDHLEWVHPKVVQRIQIGPLYAPVIQHPESAPEFVELLKQYGEEDDFVLELIVEVVLSQRSEKIGTGLLDLGKGKVREVFLMNPSDLEARREKLSRLKKRLILPHRILQNVPRDAEFFDRYRNYKPITYTKGVINVS
jgi:metal-dependent hydrolase (beta-lactamase superfamily II)